MAYGDIVQTVREPDPVGADYQNYTVGTHTASITTSAGNVLLAMWLGATGSGDVTASITTGTPTLTVFPWQTNWFVAAGDQSNAIIWYALPTVAEAVTITFTVASSTKSASIYLIEVEADGSTALDASGFPSNGTITTWAHAHDWTREGGDGFSFFVAGHTGTGVPWDAAPISDHQHDEVDRWESASKNHIVAHQVFSDAYYLHDGEYIEGVQGGGNATIKCIISFTNGTALTQAGNEGADNLLVSTETSAGSVNLTTKTLTINPLPPEAGRLMVAAWRFSADPGVVTVDDLLTDGWTLQSDQGFLKEYWKISTGSDDGTLTLTWTNSVTCAIVYAEFKDALETSPILFTAGEAVPTGDNLGNLSSTPGAAHAPEATTSEIGYLWILFHYSVNDFNSGDSTLFFDPTYYPGGDDDPWDSIVSAAGNNGAGGIRIAARAVSANTRIRAASVHTPTSGLSGTSGWKDDILVWKYQAGNDHWGWAEPSSSGGSWGPAV